MFLFKQISAQNIWEYRSIAAGRRICIALLFCRRKAVDVAEAGCDEAGRGPLAGPVYAAAVILPPDFHHPLLNDSKQLTAHQRDLLRPVIEAEAVAWAVEAVQPEEIDALNILWASVTGMQRAVLRLDPSPDFLLIDGNRFRPFGRYGKGQYRMVVKGDATFASIAAASVLAKTWRDERMRELAAAYPAYGWDRNMGYPTPSTAPVRSSGSCSANW